MKKIFIILVMGMIVFIACLSKENGELSSSLKVEEMLGNDSEITYSSMKADWPAYNDAQELIEASNLVVLGKVTGISFQILDKRTALPPTEETEEGYRSIFTMYDVDIIRTYKGDPIASTQVRMLGGMKDAYLKEQVAVLGKDIEKGIPIMEDMPEIKIGETYLFTLFQYKDTTPTMLNLEQGIFELRKYEAKNKIDTISIRDVILYFGEEQWEEFQTTFESPNW